MTPTRWIPPTVCATEATGAMRAATTRTLSPTNRERFISGCGRYRVAQITIAAKADRLTCRVSSQGYIVVAMDNSPTPALMKEINAAFNSRDVDRIMAFFADDCTF